MKLNKLTLAIASSLILIACKPNDLTFVKGSTITASTGSDLQTVVGTTNSATTAATTTSSFLLPALLGGGLLAAAAAGGGGGSKGGSSSEAAPPVEVVSILNNNSDSEGSTPLLAGFNYGPLQGDEVDREAKKSTITNKATKQQILDELKKIDSSLPSLYSNDFTDDGKYKPSTTWQLPLLETIAKKIGNKPDLGRKARNKNHKQNQQILLYIPGKQYTSNTLHPQDDKDVAYIAKFNSNNENNLFSSSSIAPPADTISTALQFTTNLNKGFRLGFNQPVEDSWKQGYDASNVSVGLIDTGIMEQYSTTQIVNNKIQTNTHRLTDAEKAQISQYEFEWNLPEELSTNEKNYLENLLIHGQRLNQVNVKNVNGKTTGTSFTSILTTAQAISHKVLMQNTTEGGTKFKIGDNMIKYGPQEIDFFVKYRLNTNNIKSTKLTSFAHNTEEKNLPNHGTMVAQLMLSIQKKLNIVAVINKLNGQNKVNNDAAIAAGLTKLGVRIFNRSFGLEYPNSLEKTKNYTTVASYYSPNILYDNLLVINSAGNNLSSTGAANAIAPGSPLRRGWLVVAGYSNLINLKPVKGKNESESDFKAREKSYNIWKSNYDLHPVDSLGNRISLFSAPCSTASLDCVVAPYVFNIKPINHHNGIDLVGTSFGTPYTTVVAATILDKYPWMSNSNIKDSILTTATKVKYRSPTVESGTEQKEIDPFWGWGLLDPNKAMNGPAKFYEHNFVADVSTVMGARFLSIFSNEISGNKGLIKTGLGQLALTANNSFTGDIEVNQGLLWLSGNNQAPIYINGTDAILRATQLSGKSVSSKSVRNSGNFIIEGQYTINGNYEQTQGAALITDLSNRTSLVIKGNANLSGTLAISGIRNSLGSTTNIASVLTTTGNLEGKFHQVVANQIFFKTLATQYKTKEVLVNFVRNNAASLTEGQSALTTTAYNLDKTINYLDNQLKQINLKNPNSGVESALESTDMALVEKGDFNKSQEVYDILAKTGRFLPRDKNGIPSSDGEYYSSSSNSVGSSQPQQLQSLQSELDAILATTSKTNLEQILYQQGASIYANNNQLQAHFLNSQFAINGLLEEKLKFGQSSTQGDFNYLGVKGNNKVNSINFSYVTRVGKYNYGISLVRNYSTYQDRFKQGFVSSANNNNLQLQLGLGYNLGNRAIDLSIAKAWLVSEIKRSLTNDGINGMEVTNRASAQYYSTGMVLSQKFSYFTIYTGMNLAQFKQAGFIEQSISSFALQAKSKTSNVSSAFLGTKINFAVTDKTAVNVDASYQHNNGNFALAGNFVGAKFVSIESNHLNLGKTKLNLTGDLLFKINHSFAVKLGYSYSKSNRFNSSGYTIQLSYNGN